jgi:uncharacterized DUF497 family protein
VYTCAYNVEVSFQWDAKKARANAQKHGVAFSDAVGVFGDACAITLDDPHPAEHRFVTMGLDFLGHVLVDCWTPRGDDIRVVSARKATPGERANYEQGE